MTYAAGYHLDPDAVRIATASSPLPDDAIESVPPVIFVDGDVVEVGQAALARAESRPQNLVGDVVREFPVDRIFLAGGRMLTPDDALRELLGGIHRSLTGVRQGPPAAVTIATPAEWDASGVERVRTIGSTLHLPNLQVILGGDARTAAADAWARVPQSGFAPSSGAGDLPQLTSDVQRASRPVEPEVALTPLASNQGSSRRTAIISAAAVGVLAIVVIVVAAVSAGEDAPTRATSTTTVPGTAPPASAIEPARSLIVGLISDGSHQAAVTAEVDRINQLGGVLGHDVELVVHAPTVDVAGLTSEMSGQGVDAAILDVSPGGPLEAIVPAVADPAALCSIQGAATRAAGAASSVTANAADCVDLLVLAAGAAGSESDAALDAAVRDLLGDSAISCTTYEQCTNLVAGGQSINYSPTDQAPQLVPNEQEPR